MLTLFAIARAHDPDGELALRPLLDAGGLAGAWTSSGLVRPEGPGWARTCEEALAGVSDAVLRPDGAVLLARADGLFTSRDHGCSVDPTPLLAASVGLVADLGTDLLLVVNGGAEDALLHLADDAVLPVPVDLPEAVQIGTVARGGDGAWWLEGVAADGQRFLRSADRGATWEVVAPPDDPDAFLYFLVGPAPDGVFAMSWPVVGTGRLYQGGAAGFAAALAPPEPVLAAACVGATCFGATGPTLLRWSADDPAGTLAAVEGPSEALFLADDGTLWGAWPRLSPALLASTRDGVGWTDALPLDAITERACPMGTPGAEACPAPPATTPGATTAPPPRGDLALEDRGGCGGGRGLVLVGLLALRGRRGTPPRRPRAAASGRGAPRTAAG